MLDLTDKVVTVTMDKTKSEFFGIFSTEVFSGTLRLSVRDEPPNSSILNILCVLHLKNFACHFAKFSSCLCLCP